MKYRFEGKEKTYSMGTYPDVPLRKKTVSLNGEDIVIEGARDLSAAARELIAAGIDPNAAKKAKKASRIVASENSFELVAREWHQEFLPTWADSHARTIIGRLENHAFPGLAAGQSLRLKPLNC